MDMGPPYSFINTRSTRSSSKSSPIRAPASTPSRMGTQAEKRKIKKKGAEDNSVTLGGDPKEPEKERPRQISDASTVAPSDTP